MAQIRRAYGAETRLAHLPFGSPRVKRGPLQEQGDAGGVNQRRIMRASRLGLQTIGGGPGDWLDGADYVDPGEGADDGDDAGDGEGPDEMVGAADEKARERGGQDAGEIANEILEAHPLAGGAGSGEGLRAGEDMGIREAVEAAPGHQQDDGKSGSGEDAENEEQARAGEADDEHRLVDASGGCTGGDPAVNERTRHQ